MSSRQELCLSPVALGSDRPLSRTLPGSVVSTVWRLPRRRQELELSVGAGRAEILAAFQEQFGSLCPKPLKICTLAPAILTFNNTARWLQNMLFNNMLKETCYLTIMKN